VRAGFSDPIPSRILLVHFIAWEGRLEKRKTRVFVNRRLVIERPDAAIFRSTERSAMSDQEQASQKTS
jgi:hypothetical protein